jgi:hypothetical protein
MVDRDGDRIGTIDAIYLDDHTSQPEWALLNTGLFGTKQTSPLAPWATRHSYTSSHPTVKPAAARRSGPEQLFEIEPQLYRSAWSTQFSPQAPILR